MENDLFIELKFNIKDTKFTTKTNIKKEYINEIISNFLSDEVGKGEDNRKANIKDIYTIKLFVTLTNDVYTCEDDCNNFGLRDGILLQYLHKGE
jgi:hypothetical protein